MRYSSALAVVGAVSALLMRLLPQLHVPVPPLAPPILRSQLPIKRPPQPWPYRKLETAHWYTNRLPNGALQVVVRHAPVPGINSSMLHWWFDGNVEGNAAHPVTGEATPRYLIWHPRDHVKQTTVFAAPNGGHGQGAYWSIQEYFMAPEPGPTQSNTLPRSQLMTVNALVRVARLDSRGLTIAAQLGPHMAAAFNQTVEWQDVCMQRADSSCRGMAKGETLSNTTGRQGGSSNGDGNTSNDTDEHKNTVAKNGSSSRDDKTEHDCSMSGVSITTHIQIGFDSIPYVPVALTRTANALVRLVFGGSDPDAVVAAYVAHSVEEYGNFQHFLPVLFRASQSLDEQMARSG